MDFQREVGEWAESVFTQATSKSIVAHLRREFREFEAVAPIGHISTPKEAADILLLLLHLAHHQGWDLMAETRQKFVENKRRRWGEPDAEGVVEHVREEVTA